MTFLDTNILVYAAMFRDPGKQAVARKIIQDGMDSGTAMISLQVLREFVNVMFKKTSLAPEEIRDMAESFHAAFPCAEESMETLARGMSLKVRHGLQFYDALVVAAAERAGCDTLVSEDMADGAVYGSVRVSNPFG